jgi:hypothetical protein
MALHLNACKAIHTSEARVGGRIWFIKFKSSSFVIVKKEATFFVGGKLLPFVCNNTLV